MPNVFAVPIFFICFRECLETSVIVSVLLSYLKQTLGPERDAAVYKKLVKQVWWGVAAGVFIVIAIGAGMIGAFYGIGKDAFTNTEKIWEGVFGLVATLIISLMGAALLRVSKLQDKWRVKLAKALESKETGIIVPASGRFKRWAEKYAMFLLPFVTVLREGLEAVIFIGGVGLGLPATSFPIAVLSGLAAGSLVGWFVYKGGNRASLQIFLIVSTCFLYLVAAGLFSKAIWAFEQNAWNHIVGGDAGETGSGPGSYDIRKSVWHVNCCNAQIHGGGGWGIFNALFGWENSATYGSVLSYNLYWLCVIAGFGLMGYKEKTGHYPFRKATNNADAERSNSSSKGNVLIQEAIVDKRAEAEGTVTNVREVREIPV